MQIGDFVYGYEIAWTPGQAVIERQHELIYKITLTLQIIKTTTDNCSIFRSFHNGISELFFHIIAYL
jgi:hypothetical protein